MQSQNNDPGSIRCSQINRIKRLLMELDVLLTEMQIAMVDDWRDQCEDLQNSLLGEDPELF